MPKELQQFIRERAELSDAELDASMHDVAVRLRALRQNERGGDELSEADEVLTPILIDIFCRVADYKLKQRRPRAAVRRPEARQGDTPTPCPAPPEEELSPEEIARIELKAAAAVDRAFATIKAR